MLKTAVLRLFPIVFATLLAGASADSGKESKCINGVISFFHSMFVVAGSGFGSECAEIISIAAEQGDVNAKYALKMLHCSNTLKQLQRGGGIRRDGDKVLRCMHEVAEQGYIAPQSQLCSFYKLKRTYGTEYDKREAARLCRLAAEQGDADAQHELSVMYLTGIGVVKDFRETRIWTLISQASGSQEASETVQKIPHAFTDESLTKEAARRFEVIESRRRNVSSTNPLVKKDGEEFAIAKPPEETNIAAEIFENTWRSVVMIKDSAGQGSGVIIRPNIVATNCHVVKGGNVAVYKPENQRINEDISYSAKIINRNDVNDFCILEVKGLWGIPATIRKYDTLKIGENVYALGAPSGLDLSLSNGLISQLRTNKNARLIQTDAAISPGSSGGGLFDTKGNFVGILTSKHVGKAIEGIGFAIPADLALNL